MIILTKNTIADKIRQINREIEYEIQIIHKKKKETLEKYALYHHKKYCEGQAKIWTRETYFFPYTEKVKLHCDKCGFATIDRTHNTDEYK